MSEFGIQDFIQSSKAYLQSDNLYNYLLPEMYSGFEQCNFSDWQTINKNIAYCRPIGVTEFLLVLCNVNYYNQKESHSTFRKVQSRNYLSSYLKVVYPLCEK